MRIGELAHKTGISVRTLRFYEDCGVLPQPARTSSGYRDYEDSSIHRLRFVASAQKAGLTLAEIKGVLALRDEGEVPCAHTEGLLIAKRDALDKRIEELEQLRQDIDGLIGRSKQLDPAECGPDSVCHVIQPS